MKIRLEVCALNFVPIENKSMLEVIFKQFMEICKVFVYRIAKNSLNKTQLKRTLTVTML